MPVASCHCIILVSNTSIHIMWISVDLDFPARGNAYYEMHIMTGDIDGGKNPAFGSTQGLR